jgi:putative flippase GtrA
VSVPTSAERGTASAQVSIPRSLPRFLAVGVASFAVDLGALFAAHGILQIWLPLATTLAYATAFTVNFSLNRIWAFGSTAPMRPQVTRYILLTCVNFMTTIVIVTGLAAAGLEYLLAKTAAATLIAILNYVAYRMWVFR